MIRLIKKIPLPIVLIDNLNANESQFYEDYFINEYRKQNYCVLNQGKTGINCGSLGSIKEFYTYEKCFEEALKYTVLQDFIQKSKKYYIKSRRTGWLKDFTWLKNKFITWSYELCYNIAKKYVTLKDFETFEPKAICAARRHGWLKDFTWLKTKHKWTKNNCFKESKKYNTKCEFQKKSPSAYLAAYNNKWLEEMNWLKSIKKPNGYWQNKDNVINEAKKYKSKSEFKKYSAGAYHSALKNKWIDECEF